MASQKPNPSSVDGAQVIESFERIPEVYREFFKPLFSGEDVFPYVVLTPARKRSGETITEKLMCTIDHTFYVLEEKDGNLTKVCYPIDEINYVEVVHRPTDLLVKISGFTNLGRPATTLFGCGKPVDTILVPLFQRIRLRIVSLNKKAPTRHMERLDRWKDLNTDVIEMARHCLLAGETVIESILQPEIRPGIFSLDKALRGSKCATHICILTDKELVLIREELALGKKDKGNSVCNFIPLSKINSLTVAPKNGDLLSLTMTVSNGEIFESVFDRSLENEVNRFLSRTRELMPKERLYRRDASTAHG